jgi:hypothetical protein
MIQLNLKGLIFCVDLQLFRMLPADLCCMLICDQIIR